MIIYKMHTEIKIIKLTTTVIGMYIPANTTKLQDRHRTTDKSSVFVINLNNKMACFYMYINIFMEASIVFLSTMSEA